jgi:signal transduction histidine kinase
MTLRARLAIGLIAIAVVLLVPLLLALHALRTAEASARAIRDEEFAASLLVGQIRTNLEDVRTAENALLFVHDEASRLRMTRELSEVAAMADSLASHQLAEASEFRAGVAALRTAADAEYEAARSNNPRTAERTSQEAFLPVLQSMDRLVLRAETRLHGRARERVAAAVDATNAAQRGAGTALLVAALLAAAIAIWLTRSISRPVHALARGMRAVAEGDFEHRLPFGANRPDEFGRLAASYESMATQLAELDRLKAEFISVASHELKTPINVVLGYLELLREGIYGELSPKQAEIFATIEKQAQNVTRLVKKLLDISRFEAGGGRIDPRPMDLNRFVESLRSAFTVLAMQREIEFTVTRGEGLPAEVSWDEDRMDEVIGNLLSNAFKFTNRGGKVSLTLESVDSYVRIEVRDTGAGIAADQLPRIFDKFYQADNQAASSAPGTGLGLAIAKQIVEAHRGTIAVDSIEQVGTTFIITLPVRVIALWGGARQRTPTGLAQVA